MPHHLHSPVRDPATIAGWVASRRAENDQLDFKADLWSDKMDKATGYVTIPAAEEFASDVCAFLNHHGGDIVLGVTDGGSCAAGWYPAAKCTFPGKVSQLRDWLNQRLDPRDACANVSFWEAMVDGRHPVLVVSVAPYAHGPVAVMRRKTHGKGATRTERLYHLFPVRDGDSTRYLEISEANRRMNARSRATYLAAAEALQFGPRPLRFASSVLVAGPGGPVPLRLQADERHATLDRVTHASLELGVVCTDRAAKQLALLNNAELQRRAQAGNQQAARQLHAAKQRKQKQSRSPAGAVSLPETAAALNTPRVVPVPLDLVRSLWHEPRTNGLWVHVVLEASLTWDGGYWLLTTR